MTKTELIERLAKKQSALNQQDVELAVKCMLEQMSKTLETGGRIEVRGFGSFSLHHHPARMSRNPKTGEAVALSSRHSAHFKVGVDLKARVNKP